MKRPLTLTILTLALLAPSSASAAAPIRECGNYDGLHWTYGEVQEAGIFNLTSRRVWCSVARHVATHAYNTYERGDRVWRWKGWYCKVLSSGFESSDTRCRKRRVHVVRWQSGA